jgi:hypothetical protein
MKNVAASVEPMVRIPDGDRRYVTHARMTYYF